MWTNENQLNGYWGPHMVGLQCWLQFLQLLWFQGHWLVTISDILPIFPQADLINIYPDRHWHSVRSAFPFAVNTPTSMLQPQLKFGMSQDWNHIFSKACCSPLLSPYVPSSSRGYPNYKHGHQPFIFDSGSPAWASWPPGYLGSFLQLSHQEASQAASGPEWEPGCSPPPTLLPQCLLTCKCEPVTPQLSIL